MTGSQLSTFCTEVNGGASIGDTLLFQFINIAKALVEQRRPWMLLRKTDTTKTVAVSSTWQSAVDLSTITDFNRFYGDYPIRLFDGSNRVEQYRQVPFEERLWYKDVPNTFVYDEANNTLYLNGTIAFAGTLYISYIKNATDISKSDNSTWVFPSWSHPLLGLLAVGIHKGGVDYDDINARMAPENRGQAEQIVKLLENWDNEKQLASLSQFDRNDMPSGYRSGAIDISA
jgi:hypothetical protein